MRLVCPECSAIYEAPDNLFGPQPREVRCNRCGYQWSVTGSRAESPAETAALSAAPPAPAIAPAPPILQPAEAVPVPPPPPLRQGAARLADSLAGSLPPEGGVATRPPAPPIPVGEPAAASTRTLLAGVPAGETIALPDAEERRLSHELDFGEPERRQRVRDGSGNTRRIALAIILIIILVIIAAMIFKTEIIGAFPALRAAYAWVGL